MTGLTLDFEGTLPSGGEPFLGPVLKIDASQSIRRAMLSTKRESRGLFLIGYTAMSPSISEAVNGAVTVFHVPDLYWTLASAGEFGTLNRDVVTDVTPQGLTFGEELLSNPGGYAVRIYAEGVSANK